MTMEEKNQLVIDYINSIKNEFEKNGSPLSDEAVKRGINRYIDSNKSFEEIKQEIDEMVEERLEQIRKRLEFLANMEKDVTRITDLDVDKIVAVEAMGIHLATALSLATDIPFVVIRKREYGLEGECEVYQKTGYGINSFN